MFSKKFDDWPICVKEKVREDFLLHIKSEIKEQPTTIIFGSLIDKDLELLRKIFPTCENYEQFDAHHLSHAYGSYFQSPFKDALVFTVDGGGSDLGAYTTTKVYAANGNNILEILKPNLDFGNTYSYIGIPISEISPGKDNNDLGVFLSYAGKIMGLCAYGNINDKWIPAFESFYLHRDIKRLGREINLDVLFNQKLKKILNAEGYDLYVPPNPNDCGQSLGQYLYKTKEHIEPLVYSGFDILDRDKFDLFLSNGKYFTEESSPEKIVSLISEGKIGGIIQGYSEVGPRALGNRSIICDPSFKDMKDILNAKVKFREWFRPFAPVCREEDMHKYFDDAFASHYMSYAPLVKKEYRDKLPSITHYDGTSRLQTVNSKQHKLFYDILSCMQNTKKIPVILNTSFNIKGRPILTKIEDAFYVLDNTELDFLVVENLLVFKK